MVDILERMVEPRRSTLLSLSAARGVDAGALAKELVIAQYLAPCGTRVRRAPRPDDVAARAADGVFHPCDRGGQLLCWHHHCPDFRRASPGRGGRRVAPLVADLDTSTWPWLVHDDDRCEDKPAWPVYEGRCRQLDRLRVTLTTALGRLCLGCRSNYGHCIDHDHVTGMVRGLLCRDCNQWIERCRHIDGCPYARYLNRPPAMILALRYPSKGRACQRLTGGVGRAEHHTARPTLF